MLLTNKRNLPTENLNQHFNSVTELEILQLSNLSDTKMAVVRDLILSNKRIVPNNVLARCDEQMIVDVETLGEVLLSALNYHGTTWSTVENQQAWFYMCGCPETECGARDKNEGLFAKICFCNHEN